MYLYREVKNIEAVATKIGSGINAFLFTSLSLAPEQIVEIYILCFFKE